MTDDTETTDEESNVAPTDGKPRATYAHDIQAAYETRPAQVGNRVRDREDDAKARVIAATTRTSEMWEIATTGETVAEHNPEYPTDSPVVLAAYERELDERFGDRWRGFTPSELAFRAGDRGIRVYAFPAHRLAITEEHWPPDDDTTEE